MSNRLQYFALNLESITKLPIFVILIKTYLKQNDYG